MSIKSGLVRDLRQVSQTGELGSGTVVVKCSDGAQRLSFTEPERQWTESRTECMMMRPAAAQVGTMIRGGWGGGASIN